ncbi:MAG: tRNA methyltransferase [Mailhella sp.]|nr:tRNA methyltransferase [Mailhella sp.]
MRAMTERRRTKIEKVLRQRQKGLTLVMDNIWDPHNVSAIYRSCDAFGVPEVHLYYTHCAFPQLSRKTSASAFKWVGTVRHSDREEMLACLRSQGMRVLATSCSPSSIPLTAYDFTMPTAIIMGNEHAGVSEDLLTIADGEVYIPMYGMVQSFNVSVASALILAEASRQRALAGMYEQRLWSDEEYEQRLTAWLDKA